MTGLASRWPTPTSPEEVEHRVRTEGILIHAAAHAAAEYTLCETDGPRLGDTDNVRLNLDSPDARALRHTVTCPDCLEWMHA